MMALGPRPTDVHRMELDLPDGAELWVKREDQSGELYGGNKVRKLEQLLQRSDGRPWLTFGAAGSHHVLASAIHAAPRGIAVHGVMIPQPWSDHAARTLRQSAARATRLWAAPAMGLLPLVTAQAALTIRREHGRWPWLIPPGGSNAIGCLGAVDLGREIAADLASGRCPRPEAVVVALGSGGTAVGLWLGLRAAGLELPVVGAVVVEGWMSAPWRLLRLARQTADLLPGRPAVQGLSGLELDRRWLGAGYGSPSEPARAAMARARMAGLVLEQTYTGRAFAAALHRLDGAQARRLLVVHSLNSRPLPGDGADPPPELAALLRRSEDPG